MDSVSLDHSLARNVFYTQSSREFRSVSLDEILNMLVRNEDFEERTDLSLTDPQGYAEVTSNPRMVRSDSCLTGIYYTDF